MRRAATRQGLGSRGEARAEHLVERSAEGVSGTCPESGCKRVERPRHFLVKARSANSYPPTLTRSWPPKHVRPLVDPLSLRRLGIPLSRAVRETLLDGEREHSNPDTGGR